MSHPTTISQPPLEPLTSTPSRLPPPPPAEALAAIDETVRRLRAEVAAATGRARQARLLMEVADLEERAGDESSAARDYLAAYNADTKSREPLESLLRLLEKRHSLRSLGKLIDALVRAAATPDEKVRALLLRSAYLTDDGGDLAGARGSADEATAIEGASKGERSKRLACAGSARRPHGRRGRAREGIRRAGRVRDGSDLARAPARRPRADGGGCGEHRRRAVVAQEGALDRVARDMDCDGASGADRARTPRDHRDPRGTSARRSATQPPSKRWPG